MAVPVKLLLSDYAHKRWGERISTAALPAQVQFVLAEAAFVQEGPCDADIAFLTREVTGKSSYTALSPELKAFQDVLHRSPRLQWLHIHPAGADRLIYGEMRERNVRITTSSGATATTVAHSATGAVIALARRFPALMDAQRRHAWEPLLSQPPRDLGGQTAVIVGLGPIGRRTATLLKALGLTVIGVRRAAEPVPPCDETIGYPDLPSVMPRADWLVLACPLSSTTRGIANAAIFGAMPDGSHLVNVSRGNVAVEADVIASLRSGKLAGAYLDVFEREPLDPASPLWDMPNVLISPHTASHSQGLTEFVFDIFTDNLGRWLRGEKLRNDIADMVQS